MILIKTNISNDYKKGDKFIYKTYFYVEQINDTDLLIIYEKEWKDLYKFKILYLPIYNIENNIITLMKLKIFYYHN